MELLWQVYEYVVCLCEIAFFYMLCTRQLGRKSGRKVLALVLIPVLAAGTFTMNRLSWSWAAVSSINLIVVTLYTLLCFDGGLTQKLIWAVVPSVVYAFVDQLLLSVMMLAASLGFESLMQITISRAIALAVYITANGLIMWFLSRRNARPGVLPAFFRILPLLIAIASIATIMVHDTQYGTLSEHSIDILPCAVSNLLIGLLCGGTALILYYASTLYQKKLMAETELRQRKLEAKNVEQIKSMYDFVRGWRHDMRGTLSTLKMLAENGKYDSMAACMQELDAAVESTAFTISTGNPAIDATISEKLLRAESRGVRLVPVLAIPAELHVNTIDACSVIMNLLDNAIEAVSQLPAADRNVDFSMQVKGSMLLVNVKNPSSGNYRFDGDKLLTTKPEQAVHGLGLERVQHIAEAHGGYVQIKPCDDSFEVSVLLGLEEG